MTEQTNPDLLQEIQDFAYRYMTPSDIALILGISTEDINDITTEYGRAFVKGRLLRKAAFNYAVIRLSDQLSSPAQAIELKMAEKALLDGLRS